MSVFTKEQESILNGIGGGDAGQKSGGDGTVFDRLLIQESGGRHTDKNGNVITSSKGAIGIAQVMPATGPEAAKLAGVEWDPEKFKSDPQYNRKLGKAYFDKQLSTFGDERLALAAYNAGPGAVRIAISRAAKSGGDPLEFLPQETQKYVPAILGSSAGVKSKKPTSPWSSQPSYIDPGFNKALEKDALVAAADESPFSTSLGRGWEGLKHNVGLFADNLAGDSEGAAERIRSKREWDEANPAPSSSDKFTQQWQKLAEDDYSGMLGAALSNPGGMLNQMVEQTPNSLPGLALQIPTAIASGALLATGWGAPIAVGLQGLAAFAGNVMPEGGAIIEERLAKSGVNPNDTAAVAKWIADNRSANIEGGVKKAGVISLVDGATGYLGAKMIAGPAVRYAKAEQAALANAGINLSDKTAVAAARATPAYKQAMAAPAKELLDATTRAQKTVRELGGVGLETVGEGVGEYAGSYAANGEASVKDAVLESLMGAGNSAAMTGANMATAAMRKPDIDRAALESLAATPVQPTIQPNSPLSNMASVGQAAQANAAAQSNLAIQQQALAEQEAGLDPSQAIADPAAAAQEAVRRRIMVEQQKAAPQQDYSAAEDAENEIGQATGFEQQDQILEFNRLLAEEQASLAEQRGDIAEAQQIRAAEAANREAIRASRARNRVGKPSGSFGQMNEFADLLREEQADIESQRAEVAAKQDQQRQTEALRAQSELESTDARVAAQMAREAEARRRDILGSVIEQGIPGVNPVADVAGRFSAELMRQGYRDTAPTDAETQSILRAVDVANAREDGPLPSLPNEGDFYAPPKAQRTAPPKAEPKPKQQPNRRLTPKEIREYVAAGAVLNGDTLTLPDGTVLKLKGPQIAAAREAMRKVAPAQVETAPNQANESEVSPQPDASQQVESRTYTPPTSNEEVSDSWHGVWKRGTTQNQEVLMAAVQKARDAGLYYNKDVNNFVAKELGVTDDDRAVGSDTIDGGAFGYDVYHARNERYRRAADAANSRAVDELGLSPGVKLGVLVFNYGKVIKAVEIQSVSEDKQSVTINGKRGKNTVSGPVSPVSIKRAIERAEERGARKPAASANESGQTKTVEPPAETYDVSTRTDDQLRYLANNGKPGWKEAAQAEMARREGAKPEIRSDLDAAAHEAATSPLNDTPQPTDGQKSAGNYKVGRVRVQGMDISIENPKGSVRSGTSPDGRKWESTLHAHYGYFSGTKAADGDHLDVYLTDGAEDAPMVWVIDQKNADGTFDEHKTLLGPRAEEEAKAAYLANYEPGWDGIGAISSMPIEAFKAWAFDGKKKRKALAYVQPEVTATAATDTATAEDAAPADPREAYADEKEQAYIAKRGGVAPPKAVMAVRIGAYREYDRQNATHQDQGQPAIRTESPTQPADVEDQPRIDPEDLIRSVANVIRQTEPMRAKKRADGRHDITVGGRPVAVMDTEPRSANEALVAVMRNYADALRAQGKQMPRNPADMTRDQFVAANELGGLLTDFEVHSGFAGIKTGEDGTFGIDHDALYDRIQAQAKQAAPEPARNPVREARKITFTIPANVASPVAGRTLTGGVPSRRVINGNVTAVVVFPAEENGFDRQKYGDEIVVRTGDKPELAALAKEYEAAKDQAFEDAIPGILEILDLSKKVSGDGARYAEQFSRMMENEGNDGIRPPKPADEASAKRLAEKLAKNPRAAQYLRALAFEEASNYMKAAAGKKAKSMLLAAEPTDKAQAVLDDWTGEKANLAQSKSDDARLRQIMTRENGWDVVKDMPEFFSPEWKALHADGYRMYALGQDGKPIESALNGSVMAKPEPAPKPSPYLPAPNPLDFTPKQYHEAKLKWIADDTGTSLAEVREGFDTEAGRMNNDDEWARAVRQAFKDGAELTRATLDKLEELRPGAFLSNLHDYPDAKIPAGYQLPSARKAEKEAADAKREARSESAQPSDLPEIFTGLSARGLAKTRAKKAAQAHPRAEQIAYVQDNFLDILTELEDSGIVKINCD